jgi:hypothetical protein
MNMGWGVVGDSINHKQDNVIIPANNTIKWEEKEFEHVLLDMGCSSIILDTELCEEIGRCSI